MAQITIVLHQGEFPNVLGVYGAEGAKNIAIDMCMAQNMELNKQNLTSLLLNLESDLEMQRLLTMDEGQSEYGEEDKAMHS